MSLATFFDENADGVGVKDVDASHKAWVIRVCDLLKTHSATRLALAEAKKRRAPAATKLPQSTSISSVRLSPWLALSSPLTTTAACESKTADRHMNAIALAMWMAQTGTPFRQADNEAFRNFLKTLAPNAEAHFPSREMVRTAIDAVYECVVGEMERELQQAQAFSLVFDGWTARGLYNSYVGVLYSFIDRDFTVR